MTGILILALIFDGELAYLAAGALAGMLVDLKGGNENDVERTG